jgi:chromosome condensin MukBEF ATPase and DNA-binding subunit MukB
MIEGTDKHVNKKGNREIVHRYDLKRELRTGLSEQNNVVDRALDETRDNIRRTVDEARKEIPRNTQAINDYQEHTLQYPYLSLSLLPLCRDCLYYL